MSSLCSGFGVTVAQANAELDLPDAFGIAAVHAVKNWADQHSSAAAVDAPAAAATINSLNADPPAINYRHRRRRLDGWLIPANDWDALTEPLRRAEAEHEVLRLLRTDWGPRKRDCASLIVAATITRSDYTALPLFRNRTHVRPTDLPFRNLAYKLMMYGRRGVHGGRGSHTLALLHALEPYAQRLAAQLDDISAQHLPYARRRQIPLTSDK
ncbi:hypothetical protein AB0K15_28465 [Amycolatopsis sp. NPDC049253]|uniref:hypothetical protein n=1 Tax=Amycolatopsis sp. NPDC049253 TaxID=3155274 RepID=UPI003425AF12